LFRYRPDVALIVVDVQNDFADPEGSLHVSGGTDVIPIINREIALARDAGALVVFTQDWHPEHTPHFAKDGGIWPDHCIQDTWGAAFHPDLDVPADARIVHKGRQRPRTATPRSRCVTPSSGETIPTELTEILRAGAIHDVVITGLATDYCVKATALDARRLGFVPTVLTDAIAAVDLQSGRRAAGARRVPGRRGAAPVQPGALTAIVLRRALALAAVAVPATWLLDRWLARGGDPDGRPAPLEMLAVVDAPIDTTWAVVADIPRQVEWMREMKSVSVDTPARCASGRWPRRPCGSSASRSPTRSRSPSSIRPGGTRSGTSGCSPATA
jgi:nicotinamidase/pyrazinamidase